MSLFDADDYLAPNATPRQPRQPKMPPMIEPVPGPGWHLVTTTEGPLDGLHRMSPDPKAANARATQGVFYTRCDKVGRSVAEIEPYTMGVLCPVCVR
jgi:hypothetical protein